MTSIIAFLIALSFGTANITVDDYQQFTNNEKIEFGKDDGVGIGGEGGGMHEDPKDRP